MLAYYQSLPAERAGMLLALSQVHALVGILLRVTLTVRLVFFVRGVRVRRAAGAPLLSAGDIDRSTRALLSAAAAFSVTRRVAVAVLRRKIAQAIAAGRIDPAATARFLADPVARSTPPAELRRTDPEST